tara:strand:- start:581 stop:805 length:225 start_codon:yes stop_codon:yes gene_type:complete
MKLTGISLSNVPARQLHVLEIQSQDEIVEVDLTDQDLSKVYDVITQYAFNRVKLKGKLRVTLSTLRDMVRMWFS